MGKGSSTINENKNVTTNTQFVTTVQKSNEVINKMMTSLTQTQLTTVAAGSVVNQELDISHIRSAGGISITGSTLKADTKLNVSMLADSNQKDELTNNLMNDMRSNLTKLANADQNQLSTESEKIFENLSDDATNTISSLGAILGQGNYNKNKNTTIREQLGVTSTTDMRNKIEEVVDKKLIEDTVNNVSASFIGTQKIKIDDVDAGGDVKIAALNEELIQATTLSAVSKSAMGNSIISKLTGQDETVIADVLKVKQTNQDDEKTALNDAQGIVEAGTTGAAKVAFAVMLPWIIFGICVVAGIIFLMYTFRENIGRSIDKATDVAADKAGDIDANQALMMYGLGPSQGIIDRIIMSGKSFINTLNSSFKSAKLFDIEEDNNLINMILVLCIIAIFFMIVKDILRMLESYKNHRDPPSGGFKMRANEYYVGKKNNPVNLVKEKKEADLVQVWKAQDHKKRDDPHYSDMYFIKKMEQKEEFYLYCDNEGICRFVPFMKRDKDGHLFTIQFRRANGFHMADAMIGQKGKQLSIVENETPGDFILKLLERPASRYRAIFSFEK